MSRLSLILLVGLIVACLLWLRSCNKLEEAQTNSESYLELLDLKDQAIDTWRDKEGRSRARAKAAQASAEALKAYNEDLAKENEGLKKDLSNLENFVSVSTSTSGSFETVLVDTVYQTKTDTVYAQTFTYSDKWSRFSGQIVRIDELQIDYNIRDSVTFVQYWKGKTFFKRGELVLEGTSHNPKTLITGIQNIKVIQPKRRKLSFGPTISYGLGGDGKFTWNVGLGLQWKMIEF